MLSGEKGNNQGQKRTGASRYLNIPHSGHSPSDASSYRSKEEIEAWIKEDSIESYRKGLIESGIASEERLDEIVEDTAGLITHILELSG